jgi:NAD(P)-dependent dehydrogenase (short-subunit alcohol dehydrogenase family)
MGLFDAFRYDGRRAVVVGGATGMGAAVAEVVKDAGGDVVVMDYAPVTAEGVTAIELNLAEKASIDAALEECGGPIHALFSCAGVDEGTPGIEKINFIGHRYLIEQAIARDYLPSGAAIAMISSAAGMGWEKSLEKNLDMLAVEDFDEAVQWCHDNARVGYMQSKQQMCTYVAKQALPFLQKGIRINATMPGPTNTPLAQANPEQWLGFGADYREAAGIEAATPLEQAYPLVFLCSEAAAGVTGLTMMTDAGFYGAGVTGAWPSAGEAVKFLRGDYGAL